MIRDSIIYRVAICECNNMIVYIPATQALPNFCPKCGRGNEAPVTQPTVTPNKDS